MLKRMLLTLTALTMALTLSLGMLTATAGEAGAEHEEPKNVAQFCQGLVEDGFSPSQGACVALFTTENFTPLIAQLCQTEEFRQEVLFFLGEEVTNTGQCVKVVKAFVAEGGR